MIRLLAGDCRDVLATLPAESVQCVVTSPPYYGLRDYGTALWDGGDAGCSHQQPAGQRQDVGREQADGFHGSAVVSELKTRQFRDTCGKCGAVRVDRQIGLERDPETYLATMVGVFREVRRVLRRDGTCWVNMGDSYNNRTKVRSSSHQPSLNNFVDDNWAERAARGGVRMSINDGVIKEKDLLMMPARLALALQADGWWVRSDVIWHKPNPMPESVTDRPTSAHEHVFLLTRSARYYYDADAVREAHTEGTHSRGGVKDITDGLVKARAWNQLPPSEHPAGRNLRNVWTIATSPFSAAHFATFPPELAERCIKAGTSERGCCAACGKPWVRVTERDTAFLSGSGKAGNLPNGKGRPGDGQIREGHDIRMGNTSVVTTTGWSAGCQCNAGTVPCTVLDPFAGAGTTLLVADRLQRDAIGIELNTAYTDMAMERCRQDAPLFTSFPPAEPPEDERMADLFAEAAE